MSLARANRDENIQSETARATARKARLFRADMGCVRLLCVARELQFSLEFGDGRIDRGRVRIELAGKRRF